MDHDAMHNYMMSVTEREVINGLLNVRNTRNHCLAYVRQINYVDMNNLKEVGKFIDLSGRTVDIEAQRLLADLRDSRVPERIEKSNIVKYTVNWTGKEGLSPSYHKEYLDEFTAHFYKRIIRLVDRAMRKEDLSSEGRIITEILQHLHAAKASVQTFQGREEELETIQRYVQSESNQPLVLHGEGGCGKTSLLAKAASMVSEWCPRETKPILILRFLGTTPDSSSVAPMLTSVCQQIMYNYSMPWEGIPDDLIPLVAFTKRLLTKVTSEQATYIFLDSVDQLAGKCDTNKLSWIPTRLPPSVKFVVSVVSEDSCPEFSAIKRIVQNEDQFVEVPSLGSELAEQTLASWLREAKRDLNKYQWKVVRRAIDKCTLPIFIKLIYADVIRWRSYTRSTETTLAHSVGDSIMKLFERIEMQHGRILVSHALSYITAAKSGLSETELEDLISLDDIVLDDVYQYHMPPVRRIPPLLWTRIRRDLPNYLSEREADGLSVMNWYHHQFRTASIARYFGKSEMVKYFHSSIAEYFLGTWGGGKQKPFKYTEVQRHRFGLADKEGAADRKVPMQPHLFHSKDGSVLRYNKRKFGELPFQLIRACRFGDLYSHVLLSYSWLHAKISCCPLQAILSDYEDAIEHINDVDICKQLNIIADALRLGSLVLGEYPDMLASQIIGTLLPVKGMFPRVADLIAQCDEEGPSHCALVPAFHCLHTPGGPLKYSLEGHPFAVFGLVLTSDQRFVISASNKFLMFDLCTGDLAREVDPEILGIMQTLALSRDDKYAVSYTNYEEIIVFNVITGDIEKIRSPLQEARILDVSIIKDTVCVWSKREWITFPAENSFDITHHTLEIDDAVVANVYFVDEEHFCLASCLSDCYLLTTVWNEQKFKDLKFRGGLAFHFQSTEAAVFVTQEADEGFHVLKYVTGGNEWIEDCVLGKITNPVLALQYSEGDSYLAAVHKMGFTVWCTQAGKRVDLHLPYNVRNISIGPFCSQSSIVLTRNKQYAVAGVRKSLYIWNFVGGRLLKEVDAHFSRILSVKSLNTEDYNALVTSSIDRSIKVWNVQNIFEKVHAIDRMELAIDAVSVTADDVLAVTLTRSSVGVWSVATGKLWSRLVDNPIGAIITHGTVTANGSYVISYESGFVLVWSLQQGAVTERAEQPNVQQLLLTDDDSHLLVTWKQNDTHSNCTLRRMPNLEMVYSISFESDVAKPAALTKDARFLVIVGKASDRECLLVHDAKNGKLLNNIPVDSRHFIGFRGISAFPGKAAAVSITANEASVIIDIEKETIRSFSYWGGACTRDGKYGLVAPPGGGLDMIDLKTGKTEKVLLPPVSEGVFSAVPKFTKTDEHVLFYHSGKKTMRLFRVSDGRMIANYRLSAEVSDFTSTNDGMSIVICGVDGSFVVLAVVDSSMPETRENLKQLPSRSDTNILSLRPTITFKTVAKVTARAAFTKRQLSREDSVRTNSCAVS